MASGFAASEKKKGSVWKILVVLFFGFVLLVGGCSFLLFRAVSGPIDGANEFLAEMQAEDYDAAWAMSDPTCFEDGDSGQLEAFFANAGIESYSLNSTSVNGSSGSAAGTITLAGADERTIEVVMTKSGDDWLVCGVDVGPAGG